MSSPLPIQFIQNEEHYVLVVEERILRAERELKIATANVKDVHIRKGKTYRSILTKFEEMVDRGVLIRILHGAPPSGPFQEALEESTVLSRNERFEMMYCPRTHLKLVIVDGSFLYAGSANFTGAGLGVKDPKRRNFETGFVTADPSIIKYHEEIFDTIWSASLCEECGRRNVCY